MRLWNIFVAHSLLVLSLMLFASESLAQSSSNVPYRIRLVGPSTADVGVITIYRIEFYDSNGAIMLSPEPSTSRTWSASGADVLLNWDNEAQIKWFSPGGQFVSYEYETIDNFGFSDEMNVIIRLYPHEPNTTFTIIQDCGSTAIQRDSNPPSDQEWYWQTSSEGTSTALGSGPSITRNSPGFLYLRARLKNSPYTWGETISAGYISIAAPPPSPATSTDGHAISHTYGIATLAAEAVSGATKYNWYRSDGTTVSLNTTNSIGVQLTQPVEDFYVESRQGNCLSNTRTKVTGYLHPGAIIKATNDGAVTMGEPVTLSVSNYTYDSYAWFTWNAESSTYGTMIPGATQQNYTTDRPGTYKVVVMKGNAARFQSDTIRITIGGVGLDMNYIISNTILKEGVTSAADIDVLPVTLNSQTIQYFDGLGRPMQSVVTQSSPDKQDIVQPMAYDAYGRTVKNYLPYVGGNNGRYKEDALKASSSTGSELEQYRSGKQYAFYQKGGLLTNDQYPYAETTFEPSPLNRVIKQGAPGEAWQPNTDINSIADKTVKKRYETNQTKEVLLFTYDSGTGTLLLSADEASKYYGINQLYANKTYDENNNEIIEYVDKEGRTVCKKVQYGEEGGIKLYACTYYIYDDLDNLVVVLPPEGIKALVQE